MFPTRKQGTHAVLWLAHEQLFLGTTNRDGAFEVRSCTWNPGRLDLQSPEAHQKLTQSLQLLSRQHGLHRHNVRLCLDDSFCVTRVVTGEADAVESELAEIRSRSPLYISLGLGDKLTGSLAESRDGQSHYALTSIANLRTIQAVYSCFLAARIRLVSIEPVALASTRALGALEVDKDQPVMFLSVDANRCDLGISRGGRLMLSYRMSGVTGPKDIAEQIGSHLTRLRRFCQRFRRQDGTSLDNAYIFGDQSIAEELGHALADSKLQVACARTPDSLCVKNSESLSPTIVLILWAAQLWDESRSEHLPAPDWLQQLEKLQSSSLQSRLLRHFLPASIAASMIFVVQLLQWNDYHQLALKKQQLDVVTADVAIAESELQDWESKKLMIDSYHILESRLGKRHWDQLIVDIAPCLPNNARLEALTLSDEEVVTLRGMMVNGDSTYEMLTAIKQLPVITDVSLESVSAVGSTSLKQLQFEVKCRLVDASKPPVGKLIGSKHQTQN